MKNIFKRLSCLMLVASLVFCFAACSGGNSATPASGNDPQLEKLVQDEGKAFETSFEQSFSSSSGGTTCECKLSVDGTKLIVDCLIKEADDVPAETKAEMQEAYDKNVDQLSKAFEPIKKDAPNLSEVTLNICEKDGDVIASVRMPF